jgi:hypothetical protein
MTPQTIAAQTVARGVATAVAQRGGAVAITYGSTTIAACGTTAVLIGAGFFILAGAGAYYIYRQSNQKKLN